MADLGPSDGPAERFIHVNDYPSTRATRRRPAGGPEELLRAFRALEVPSECTCWMGTQGAGIRIRCDPNCPVRNTVVHDYI